MLRFKLSTELHQEYFEDLEAAKGYVHTLPKGTVVTVTDTMASPGDDAYYSFISGTLGFVTSRHLPAAPLR